ncbi:MAG: MoaD/ThiS family protein [Thermoplasmataceae archaeon]
MIRIVGRNRETYPIQGQTTVGELASQLRITESAYITLKNGVPVTSDEPVSTEDDIVFMEVFSGG